MPVPRVLFLPRTDLQRLIDALRDAGYDCVGPRVDNGAVVFGPLDDASGLPHGVRDLQAPGRYRLESGASARCFAWANGPQALKPLVFAPRETVWECRRDANGVLRFDAVRLEPAPTAVFGVRACDLAALDIQDRHFMVSHYFDPAYAARRRALFLIAVNCTHPADTCFCASTGDGPVADAGYDLLLDELDDGFLLTPGSEPAEQLVRQLALASATTTQRAVADRQRETAFVAQTRRLPSRNLRGSLLDNLDHPQWEDVAGRCLSCGNCTSVCPTCFCFHEYDDAVLSGGESAHRREWDSCFSQRHSYIHGLTVRPDTRSRYRQWLVHKLGTWHDQYGRSGCVGCGRCISWCPAGIDLTAEVAAICGDGDAG